jgi:hypothetical protein
LFGNNNQQTLGFGNADPQPAFANFDVNQPEGKYTSINIYTFHPIDNKEKQNDDILFTDLADAAEYRETHYSINIYLKSRFITKFWVDLAEHIIENGSIRGFLSVVHYTTLSSPHSLMEYSINKIIYHVRRV